MALLLEHTTPHHAALIVATSPLITLLADAALARRAPRPVTLGFVLLALAGVLLVIGRGNPLATSPRSGGRSPTSS